MSSIRSLRCPYCPKKFHTDRGLEAHIKASKGCSSQRFASLNGQDVGYRTADQYVTFTSIRAPKRHKMNNLSHDFAGNPLDNVRSYGPHPFENQLDPHPSSTLDDSDNNQFPGCFDTDDNDDGLEEHDNSQPTTIIVRDFKNYVRDAVDCFEDFTKKERNAIELLFCLRKTKASLGTYEEIQKWHLSILRRLGIRGNFSNKSGFTKRASLYQMLYQRYNMFDDCVNIIKEITLPHSRALARIVTNDVKWCLQSLLSDPRIVDEDYLFHNDNPLSPPPDKVDVIKDINTGDAYLKSYCKYIKKPGEVLLPIICYIDGAATGQFVDLPITPFKITLGIFNKQARTKLHTWRTLGYVPAYSSEQSSGRRTFYESGHIDSAMHQDLAPGEGNTAGSVSVKAQDLHAILAIILDGFVEIQQTGFVWDLMYRGKLFPAVKFVPYVHFIKADTEEADRLVGKYTSRTQGVKHLCRYCCCPTSKTNQPRAMHNRKTVPMIADLIRNKDETSLKEMSQHLIDNACYKLRFGAHNEDGVHGSCPVEMLHCLHLGIFKYVRDCFFDQIGQSSVVVQKINGLAVKYGELFSRQSDRNMPKTKFANGIQKGKLMGKEYEGVLLLIAIILRSTYGSSLLQERKGTSFSKDEGIEDWIRLVETLLMWVEWLKSDEIPKKLVNRAKRKHQFIMYLIRKVADRQKGMGLKITKFHAITHMADDILFFGTPMCFDTGSDEAGHKPAKIAAKVTQKRKDRFDEQVGKRMAEVHVLDLAMSEIDGKRKVWDYYLQMEGQQVTVASNDNDSNTPPYGHTYAVTDVHGQKQLSVVGRVPAGFTGDRISKCFVDFVSVLQDKVFDYHPRLLIYSSIRRRNDIYRGTQCYDTHVWRDWVLINWDTDGCLPARIWGFVDLPNVPEENSTISCGGQDPLAPGIYAIIESAEWVKDKRTDIVSEISHKADIEVSKMKDGRVVNLKFYLADVESFHAPLVVVPDIGGPANRYIVIRSRGMWVDDFAKWLGKKYEDFPEFDDDIDSEILLGGQESEEESDSEESIEED